MVAVGGELMEDGNRITLGGISVDLVRRSVAIETIAERFVPNRRTSAGPPSVPSRYPPRCVAESAPANAHGSLKLLQIEGRKIP